MDAARTTHHTPTVTLATAVTQANIRASTTVLTRATAAAAMPAYALIATTVPSPNAARYTTEAVTPGIKVTGTSATTEAVPARP